MNKRVFILGLIFLVLITTCAFASTEVPEYIKIGLYYGTTAAKSVTLKADSGLIIGTRDGENFTTIEEVEKGKTITITKGSDDYSVNISGIGEIGDEENIVRIIPNENSDGVKIIYVNDKRYRGDIEFRRFSNSDMTVINVLKMQEYLYGVVPREIGGNSPIEAVKAQAILARTYATKNYNKRSSLGFNLYPTVSDQAYGGYEWENVNSNKAVDETAGMVVTYDDELIGGYYFSTSGGYTEDSENVWGGDFGYLEAVPDTYEPTNLKMSTWTVTMTAEEVKEKLGSSGIDIGDIINIVPTKFSDVGRVTELKIIGTKGEKVFSKEKARTCLGLYSQWYTVNSEAPKAITVVKEEPVVEKEKPLFKKLLGVLTGEAYSGDVSAVSTKEVDYSALTSAGVFLIQGRGWGHAVGMSQNGAIGMANNNFSYEEIIKWYYSGTKLQK